jgi:hypothetical protein
MKRFAIGITSKAMVTTEEKVTPYDYLVATFTHFTYT